jgi:hypothetical protein
MQKKSTVARKAPGAPCGRGNKKLIELFHLDNSSGRAIFELGFVRMRGSGPGLQSAGQVITRAAFEKES